MTTSINREALLRTLSLIRPALATADYIPALMHVKFDGDFATAFNDISAIAVACDVEVKRCVPGDLLIRSLGSFGGATVALAFDAKTNALLVSSGRSKIKLPTLGLDDFPFEVDNSAAPEIKLTPEIIKGIERCLISVGSDPTHPEQMGVTLDIENGGHAVLYSTDNFTVSRCSTKSKIELPGDAPVILPTFFCQQLITLSKAYPDEKPILVLLPDALIVDIGVAATLYTKVMADLTPIDFPKILKKNADPAKVSKDLMKIPDALDAAFSRALLVLGADLDKITKVKVDAKELKLVTSSAMGDADDEIDLESNITPTEFLVDPAIVVRGLKSATKIAFLPKCVALGDDSGTFLHLIAHCA